jgi:signal recognition particle subunit SRP54
VAIEFNLDDLARQLPLLRQADRSHVLDYFRENRAVTAGRLERIIGAMNPQDRQNPGDLGPRDRQRIARGCGLEPQDIEEFLEQFGKLRAEMQQIANLGFWQRLMVAFGWQRLPVKE